MRFSGGSVNNYSICGVRFSFRRRLTPNSLFASKLPRKDWVGAPKLPLPPGAGSPRYATGHTTRQDRFTKVLDYRAALQYSMCHSTKQAENDACNRSHGKQVFSRCGDSHIMRRKFMWSSTVTRFATLAIRLAIRDISEDCTNVQCKKMRPIWSESRKK